MALRLEAAEARLRSILQTSRRIAAACADQLETRPAVILAYPLRCTDWLFYKGTFCRQGIGFHCVSLTAQAAHIAGRDRVLTCDLTKEYVAINGDYRS